MAALQLDDPDQVRALMAVGQRFADAGAQPLGLVQPAVLNASDRLRVHLRDLGQGAGGLGHGATLRASAAASSTVYLSPRAGRGQHGKKKNPDSALVRGRLREFEPLRIVERPPHPTLSPQAGRGSETPAS